MKLLIIEDDPRIAETLRAGLSEEKFLVEVAEDGEQGEYLATALLRGGAAAAQRRPRRDAVCRRPLRRAARARRRRPRAPTAPATTATRR